MAGGQGGQVVFILLDKKIYNYFDNKTFWGVCSLIHPAFTSVYWSSEDKAKTYTHNGQNISHILVFRQFYPN